MLIFPTLIMSFCFSLFSQEASAQTTPQWLSRGIDLYFADYFPETTIEQFKNNIKELPTFEQLESLGTNNTQSFTDNELLSSYLLAKFIDEEWNRETLLSLLDNYENLEKTLKFTKKDIEHYWHYSVLYRPYGFRSGDYWITLIIDDIFNTFTKALSAPQKNMPSFSDEQIVQAFESYKMKFMDPDTYILIAIQTNSAIAGWALFSVQSERAVTLEALCINPEHKKYDIGKKLLHFLSQKFRSIKSITTMNKNISTKTTYFCGEI